LICIIPILRLRSNPPHAHASVRTEGYPGAVQPYGAIGEDRLSWQFLD
jgi:hypothetical protein